MVQEEEKAENLQNSSIINFLDEIFSAVTLAPNHYTTVNIWLFNQNEHLIFKSQLCRFWFLFNLSMDFRFDA